MTLLQPKVIIAVTLLIVGFILISLAQEVNRRWQTQREIQKLETQVHDAQKQVVELQNLNQYFSTDDYQERLAREKLNYQGPGEHVVAVPDNVAAPTPVAGNTAPIASISIPLAWWKVFFVDDPSLSS